VRVERKGGRRRRGERGLGGWRGGWVVPLRWWRRVVQEEGVEEGRRGVKNFVEEPSLCRYVTGWWLGCLAR
jgi:hypothetical protein